MSSGNADYALAGKRVWVAGHRGLVGSALLRRLESERCDVLTATRGELDLRRQQDVEAWVADAKPDAVFLAAAKVGGILANKTYPADFMLDNLLIEANVIKAARDNGVEKLLFLGSACIYPRAAEQPIPEDALMSGPLEPTNAAYAVAKIAGVGLCDACRAQYGSDFISAMPNNLYGPGDNFDLQNSHVLPALMRKAHEAKTHGDAVLTVWGSGTPQREFLYVDDLADAAVFLMRRFSDAGPINVGSEREVSIRELAHMVRDVVGYEGELRFDRSMPDGVSRRLVDGAKLHAMGWTAKTSLPEGLRQTYAWLLGAKTIRA